VEGAGTAGGGAGGGTRFVSFTFDDGLVRSCRRAADILEASGFRGSFFVVTSWVGDRALWVSDRTNRGLDHGEWSDWRELAERGHEVASHSHRHLNATGRLWRHLPGLLARDYRRSREVLRRELGAAPETISMPWNARTDNSDRACASLFRRIVAARGTPSANPRGAAGPLVRAWAPGAGTGPEAVAAQVRGLEEGQWLVLQFHGFDGEGWEPVPASDFEKMVKACAGTRGVSVVPVRGGPGAG
jgi:peptidoglycan/xylan/chitin deacetylase (PgdA/CDA1 family)